MSGWLPKTTLAGTQLDDDETRSWFASSWSHDRKGPHFYHTLAVARVLERTTCVEERVLLASLSTWVSLHRSKTCTQNKSMQGHVLGSYRRAGGCLAGRKWVARTAAARTRENSNAVG